jgi:hypothetical protein
MRRPTLRHLSLAVGALWLIAGCNEPTATRSADQGGETGGIISRATAIVTGSPTLLACPSSSSSSASATIGSAGGFLKLDGNLVVIPKGAVSQDTRFTITVPASQNLVVDVSADGYDTFTFALPVLIAVDYSRCPDDAIPSTSLAAWYVDRATTSPLQLMGSFDDRRTEHVIFATGHLSGYAIAE